MGTLLRTLFVFVSGFVLPGVGIFASTGILAVHGKGRDAGYWAWPFAIGLTVWIAFWVLIFVAIIQAAPSSS